MLLIPYIPYLLQVIPTSSAHSYIINSMTILLLSIAFTLYLIFYRYVIPAPVMAGLFACFPLP